MLLTQKLLSYLSRVFDKDPARFLALRLSHVGSMAWRVQDGVLTTTVAGVPDLSVDLSQHTIASLVTLLSAQPGYAVPYSDGSELSVLGALTLLDGSNDIAASNGDHLYAYTSTLWAFLEPLASELTDAAARLREMLRQMSTRTAGDIWLDEIGGYYGVPRLAAEPDSSYGPRIIAEVLRPRSNNVALQEAIRAYTGQATTVTDVTLWTATAPLYDGSITHDGTSHYDAAADPLYGLFDVEYGYDLINGGDFEAFATIVRGIIDRLRAAGTHLRSLVLSGSEISDEAAAPTDEGGLALTVSTDLADDDGGPAGAADDLTGAVLMALDDAADSAGDDLELTLQFRLTYNGLRSYDGFAPHIGTGAVPSESV